MSGPLSDIRVLDISTVLAGPNCARYFADFGADVIKVERPDTGDSLRGMAWRDPRDGSGLWWKLVNRNKRNIALDLKSVDDRELFLHLLDDANVLVDSDKMGRTQNDRALLPLQNRWLDLLQSVASQTAHRCCLQLL